MRLSRDGITFSAPDLVNFLGCRHSTFLDVKDLARPADAAADDPFLELLQAKGPAHEQRYLESLRIVPHSVVYESWILARSTHAQLTTADNRAG